MVYSFANHTLGSRDRERRRRIRQRSLNNFWDEKMLHAKKIISIEAVGCSVQTIIHGLSNNFWGRKRLPFEVVACMYHSSNNSWTVQTGVVRCSIRMIILGRSNGRRSM